jgi:adenosylhomocysteine nucleosidase
MSKKIVGLICAMEVEIQKYFEILTYVKEETILNHHFFLYQKGDYDFVLLQTGIGKINAAMGTTLLIEHYHPDFVINSGIAGGYHPTLETLDTVIATKIYSSDADQTSDITQNLAYGQLQGLPSCFCSSEELVDTIRKKNLPHVLFGAIASGDQFVTNYQKTKKLVDEHFSNENIVAFDMESYAIAQICYLTSTSFMIVRAISDIIGSNRPFDYSNFSKSASMKAVDLVIHQLFNIQ